MKWNQKRTNDTAKAEPLFFRPIDLYFRRHRPCVKGKSCGAGLRPPRGVKVQESGLAMTSSLHPRCSERRRRPRLLGGPALCIRYGKDPQMPSKREGQLHNTFSATPSQGASVSNSASNRCGQSGKKPPRSLRPAVRRPVVRTGIFSVQRPFPVCEFMPRTTWVQGLFPLRNQDKG